MPVKGDSAKKVKKSEKDGSNSGPNKKLKRSESLTMKESKKQQEITMTIPRKKDKEGSTSKKSAKSTTVVDSKDIAAPIPKIPKKSTSSKTGGGSNSNSSNTSSEKDIVLTIPKKTTKTGEKRDSTSNKQSGQNDKVAENNEKAGSATSNQTSSSSGTSTTPVASSKAERETNSTKSSKKGGDKSENTSSSNGTGGSSSSSSNKKTSKSQDKQTSSGGNSGSNKRKSLSESTGTPGRPPKIDTALSNDTSNIKENVKVKTPQPTGTAMDTHPYARGSVIEVLHGDSDPSADDWWSDDSDDDENTGEDNENGDTQGQKKHSIRLCDIIDRVSVGEKKWRYYVHYRDFNRRMDEWIPMERIVSPPSVGNAKARAIKKEEERQKRKQQRLEERNAELNAGVDVSAPRASRRRSSTVNQAATAAALDSSSGGTGGGADGDSETPRRTRLQRKRSFMDDDNTVVASNQQDKSSNTRLESPHDGPIPPTVAAENGIVAIPTTAATHTTVGEHIVATIPAQELDEHEGLDEASLREHEEVTKVKNVAFVELGPYQMETWYFSPLPKELLSEKGYVEVLYVCEFSFSLFSRKSELQRFQARLPTDLRHPPGNEIYRNVFEVDGFEERIYCQNLCYIAKLFLDHKTLYFDVDPFLFYVLCEVDNRGFHPVGYYSKEKYSDVGYNLACILTFPSHQRKGYGRFLIAFSYELSKKEEKVGSPEKPMSDLGQQAYKPYWASTVVDFLLNQSGDAPSMSIMDISKKTSIMAEDIVFTLNQLGILKIVNGVYFVAAEQKLLQRLAKKFPVKNPKVDPSKLHWTPFVTDVKRDKFSIHSKKPSVDGEGDSRGSGGFP